LIVGIGLDLVEVSRFKEHEARGVDENSDEIFTALELIYCRSKRYPERHLAARFAAREAFLKALGSGALTPGEFKLIEVAIDEQGKPSLIISGKVAQRADERGVKWIQLSMTHTSDTAAAVVVLEG